MTTATAMKPAHEMSEPTTSTSLDEVIHGQWLTYAATSEGESNARFLIAHYYPENHEYSICGRRHRPRNNAIFNTEDHTLIHDDGCGQINRWAAPDGANTCAECNRTALSAPYCDNLRKSNMLRPLPVNNGPLNLMGGHNTTMEFSEFNSILNSAHASNYNNKNFFLGFVTRYKVVNDELLIFTDVKEYLTRATTMSKITYSIRRYAAARGVAKVKFIAYN